MENNDRQCWDGAKIERGQIVSADENLYTIRSFGRDGLEADGLPALNGGEYAAGDKVYFFLFGDGKGAIIGGFE